MKTLNYHSLANSYRKFAMVCSFASCIAFLPVYAGDTNTTPDKNSLMPGLSSGDSNSALPADIQIEEEMEMEAWMLNPEHSSWMADEETEISLAHWMTDIKTGNWMADSHEEEIPALQSWMLTPSDWL